MPWTYSGTVESITPSTSDDNWTLDAVSAGVGKLKEVFWGGESTSSTAMRTRVARASGEAGTGTAGNVAKYEGQGAPANDIDFFTTYANGGSAQPTLNAASLFALSWNNQGGVVRWLADVDEEIWLITGQTLDLISCRNAVGTGTSTYGTVWSEIST
jgi:hypothetical protein